MYAVWWWNVLKYLTCQFVRIDQRLREVDISEEHTRWIKETNTSGGQNTGWVKLCWRKKGYVREEKYVQQSTGQTSVVHMYVFKNGGWVKTRELPVCVISQPDEKTCDIFSCPKVLKLCYAEYCYSSIYDKVKQDNIWVTVTWYVDETFMSKIAGGRTDTGASTFIDFIVYLVLVYHVLLE